MEILLFVTTQMSLESMAPGSNRSEKETNIVWSHLWGLQKSWTHSTVSILVVSGSRIGEDGEGVDSDQRE